MYVATYTTTKIRRLGRIANSASFELEKPLTMNDGSQLPIDTATFFAISALQQV